MFKLSRKCLECSKCHSVVGPFFGGCIFITLLDHERLHCFKMVWIKKEKKELLYSLDVLCHVKWFNMNPNLLCRYGKDYHMYGFHGFQ